MKRIIIIFLTCLLISACKKENSNYWTEVHVAASNFNTGEPLTDLGIVITQTKQNQFNNSDSETILEGTTDANGEFQFGWKAKRSDKYSYVYLVQASPTKYFPIEFLQVDNISKGQKNEYNIKMVEYGLLNMNFQNINCEGVDDELYYRYYLKKSPADVNHLYNYSEFWTNDSTSLDSCVNLTGNLGYKSVPAGTYTVEWNVTRNSGFTEGTDEIVVPDGDSVTYVLQY